VPPAVVSTSEILFWSPRAGLPIAVLPLCPLSLFGSTLFPTGATTAIPTMISTTAPGSKAILDTISIAGASDNRTMTLEKPSGIDGRTVSTFISNDELRISADFGAQPGLHYQIDFLSLLTISPNDGFLANWNSGHPGGMMIRLQMGLGR